MDGDSKRQEQKSEDGDHLSDGGDVPKPLWIRPFSKNDNGLNGFLLDYNAYFLPCSGIIIWTIFLFF